MADAAGVPRPAVVIHAAYLSTNMKTLLRCLALAIVAPTLLIARPAEEDRRIEHLLKTVKSLENATFVRSGKGYDGATAEAHLRKKLKHAGERVQTAEQFIEGVASKSYLTGGTYKIRFADGREIEAGEFLRGKLAAMTPKKGP